jgi:SAM-dependent methyltransferase
MDPIFDHESLAANRRRARHIGDEGAAFLMNRAAEDLADRLSTVGRQFACAAILPPAGDAAAAVLGSSGKVADIVEPEDAQPEVLALDAESIDLAISLYGLHAMNDVPGMLVQIRRALRPDGLFLGCMAGSGTLNELRDALLAAETELSGGASPRVFPFADVRDAGALLQRAGFALPVADIETVTVRYETMFGLMRDLRAMGAANALVARSRKPASRALFMRAAEIYAERFSDDDGRIRATFSTIWLSGWAPHASQQKPLARGSATVSLTQVLGKGTEKP